MAMSWNRGSGLAAAGVVAMVAVAVPTERSHAQMGMMMQGQMGTPAITRKGFEGYSRILGLDADQKEVAKTLMEGNRAANKSLMEDMQAKVKQLQEKLQDSRDWESFQKDVAVIAKDYRGKSSKLQEQFFDDLKGILNDSQMEKFPAVERFHHRELAMRFPLTFGASTDIVEIARVAKLDVDHNEELKAAIERYELDLDSILKGYEKLGNDSQDAASTVGFDPEKITAAIKPLTDAAKQVRDINRAAAKRIAGLITDEATRDAFELEVKRAEFPRIYKESYVEKSMAAAAKLSGLEESQKDQIKSLSDQYKRDAASKNERWAKALEEKEDKAGGRISMLMNMWGPQGEEKNEVADAKKARLDLDEATQTRLEGILKEDQKAQLPQKRPDKGGFGFGMFEDFGWDFTPEQDE